MIRLIYTIIFLTLTVVCFAQNIVLNPTSPLEPCIELVVSGTLFFERGDQCDADVIIVDAGNNEIFRSSDQTFSYTFDEIGDFVIFCGAGPGAVAMAAVCVTAIVPTLSQWSIICLSLLLIIFGVCGIRTSRHALSRSF